ncbi:MAG TPA: nucleoside recognition domain-containing protein [Myxococcota bacterium]
MLNWIWLGLILGAVVYAALTGRMQDVSTAIFEDAKGAIQLVINLTGIMILFLGVMNVARDGGLLTAAARLLRPLLRRLFPDVPPDHPAMGAMVMNLASNVLGLGNAATPFGLKAMSELNRLNPHPGVATNSMVLFLAINTSAVTLMAPTGTIGVRAAAGSVAPMAIWIPTLIATLCSTTAAVTAFYLLRGRRRYAVRPRAWEPSEPDESALPEESDDETLALFAAEHPPVGPWQWIVVLGTCAALAVGLALEIPRLRAQMPPDRVLEAIASHWLTPLLIVGLLLVGFARRVRVYESMVTGAREGLALAVRIVPFLVAILVAVGMFRASGLLELLIRGLDPLTSSVGFPAEALPMALLRPLSGTGAFGVMAEILETHGPDSFVGMLASTLQGSTETTFYVLTVYCGAAGIRDVRHALPACLIGDLGGFIGATAACHLFFG